MATKTKEAAMKAARKALGPTAAEGVDYQLRNTGAGWVHEPIPPANEPAKAARAKKAAKPKADPIPAVVRKRAAKAEKSTRALKATAAQAAEARGRAERRKAAGKEPTRPAPKPKGEQPTKTDLVMSLISRPSGATSKQLEEATSWAPHSVRGLLGTFRANGVKVVSTKEKGCPTVYRVSGEVGDVI